VVRGRHGIGRFFRCGGEGGGEKGKGAMPPPSLDGSDRAAPPSLARSDCSSIRSRGSLDGFVAPRPEGHGGKDFDGAATPRLPSSSGVMPHFTCVCSPLPRCP